MNKHIKRMIIRNMIFGGRITNNNGFIMFQRLPLEELENLDESQIAFATQSMGRAVFTIDSRGIIRNYKGVDSHLDNKEISTSDLVGAESVYISNPGKSYSESTYPINLVVYLGKKVDIRIRGGSPLEDLEIEADINAKMQEMGIKLPQIVSVREFPNKMAREIGLPAKIKGSYEEFESDYTEENKERKESLHKLYGRNYSEEDSQGLRPEKISEFFERIGVLESQQFQQFAKKFGVTVDAFINYVDKQYSLGQRYGQAERIVESPFRIADLEYYIKKGDVGAIRNIVEFSEQSQRGQSSMEEAFAQQMGINIANMMNSGWMCENFVHRQDYTLAGEMCDDTYFDVIEHLKGIDNKNRDNEGKRKALKKDVVRKYFLQFYLIGSNIKVLQDEMKLRGRTEGEINSVISLYIDSFAQNLDFQKIGTIFSIEPEKVNAIFANMIGIPRDYAKLMASQDRPEGDIQDESILFAHSQNNDFYNELSSKLAEQLNIDRSGIEDELESLIEDIASRERITSDQLIQMEMLDRGGCSTLYKYSTDTVIKVLNQSGLELHNEETFFNIVGIENSTCVFPRDRVYIDGTFQGYTMECVQGKPLHESIRGMDLDQLMAAIQLVEDDLKRLSLERILFQDLNQGSIMWDDEKGIIKIIDTDFFVKDENIQPEGCYEHNMNAFNTIMEMELGILNGQDTDLLNYLRNNPIFSEAYRQYILASIKGENRSVRELIGKAVEVFEKEFRVKVKSIEEMEQLIRARTGCDGEKPIKREGIPIFTPPTAGGNLLEDAIATTEEFTRKSEMDQQLRTIIEVLDLQRTDPQEQVEKN